MQVLTHPDPRALEHELVERLDAVHPRGRPGRTLVIVPTARLAEHVMTRALQRRPAWLGLEVLHLRTLALRMIATTGRTPPALLPPRIHESLLRDAMSDSAGSWAAAVRKRPGVLHALAASVTDLREAGVSADEFAASCRDDRQRELAAIYSAWLDRLDRCAAAGWVDETALNAAAAGCAEEFLTGVDAVFVYGAYEWVGAQLALIRTLDGYHSLTALVPYELGSRISEYAESSAIASLGGEFEPLVREPQRRKWLASLYDQESTGPSDQDRPSFAFRHAQGSTDEVRAAVRHALAAVADGCPAAEILLCARSLEPYASALEEVFGEEELPWTTSLRTPLRRHPLVRDFLALIDLVVDDFPRRSTSELLRSSRIDWSRLHPEGSSLQDDTLDAWSRKHRITGGLRQWTRRTEIGRTLTAMAGRIDGPAGWTRHALRLGALLRDVLAAQSPADETALHEIESLLEQMSLMERLVEDDRPRTLVEARDWLSAAVDATLLALHPAQAGGLRVLDAMQARGITCRRLFLLGANSGLLPRPAREDPILNDRWRGRIRRDSGRPVPIKSEAGAEERLILSMLLGSAAERIELSWQRADESGRAKTPSLALREVARLAHGDADLARVVRSAARVPSHPGHLLDWMVQTPGLLAPHEEPVRAALNATGAGLFPLLEARFGELGPGLRMLASTQSFEPHASEYDGHVSLPERPNGWSVSELETLGRCPLQYFFRHELKVGELEAEPSLFRIESQTIGLAVHDLLEHVYGRLEADGLLLGAGAAATEAALDRLADEWSRVGDELGGAAAQLVPLLWKRTLDVWREAVVTFVRSDLLRIAASEADSVEFESSCSTELDFGEGVRARLRGRFDRVLTTESGPIVSDYKTTRSLKNRGDAGQMLKGLALQVPLYRRMAAGNSRVELLAIHPDFPDDEEPRSSFEGFADDEQARSFDDTMRVLLQLAREGHFPFLANQHCNYCPYTAACRRTHPPSQQRRDLEPSHARFLGCARKTRTKPMIGIPAE